MLLLPRQLRTSIISLKPILTRTMATKTMYPASESKQSYIKDGEFKRQVSSFRDAVSREPGAKFPPEKGRYHLYVSYACPWATRTLITRQLKGLQDIISVDVVDWYLDMEKGWTFTDKVEGSTLDRVNGVTYIRELYKKADPDYSARCTVPVFWDKKLNTIVNNESAEIIRFMNTEFDDLIEDKYKGLNFYPPSLQPQIDEFNDWIYNDINNGVYKSGFATTQEAYEHNVVKVFESLDRLEKHLETHSGPYILGDHLTEVDIRLYVTIIRFDPVYVQHFKCNVRTIRDGYPRIHKWLQNLYWNHPAFKDNTNFDHIKFHYTKSHPQINPTRITPVGPIPNILPFGKPTGKLYIH